jgi:uncharacterized protein
MSFSGLVSLVAERCRAVDHVVVALSGGVDSGLTAAAVHAAMNASAPERPVAVAVTVCSELTADGDFTRAAEVAEQIGIEHHPLCLRMLQTEGVRRNGADRCYYCKSLIFQMMRMEYGDDCLLVDGTNADDDPLRPGLRAAREQGVYHPLKDAGLTKAEVRAMARMAGLANWDAPSESCLATRLATGVPLSLEGLDKVRVMESFLRERGVASLRARHDNLVATVEFPAQYAEIIAKNRDSLAALIKRIGLGSCELKELSE